MESKEAILKMDKAIICLEVELPNAVWKSVNDIWQQAKAELRKENEELKRRVINLQQADMTHEHNVAEAERVWPQIKEQIEEPLKELIEYWKQRCEAAEEEKRTYSEWYSKSLTVDGTKENVHKQFIAWEEAYKKWQQLKNQEDENKEMSG